MTTTMWRQPKTVWSIAFACVISFMGIGLVDPILKPIADELGAGPSQVSLLFTSYLAVMGIAMLGTGWVSSRVGAKRTLLLGLALIIVGAALAGSQDTVGGIVAFRALWGLGNALFIATALATIVNAASGSVKQAIILYEAALGVGIATGPLLGGWLGGISWRWPFYGVAVLMAIAFIATLTTLPQTPPAGTPTSLSAPLRALGHRGLLTVGVTALLYNFGFFTLLAFTPFPLAMGAHQIGFIFFGWGLLLAITSVFVAPMIQRRFGTMAGIVGALLGFAVILAVMAAQTENKTVLVVGVILAGAFLGREQHAHHRDGHEGRAGRAWSRVGGILLRPLQRRRRGPVAGRQPRREVDPRCRSGSARALSCWRCSCSSPRAAIISALDEAPGHGAEAVTSRTRGRGPHRR